MAGKSMIIDGIAASEAIDSSGEILDIEGCDISDLQSGKATLNYEHRGDDAPGASPNDHIGRITFAKKIFKEADCANSRERMYWREVQLPLIYIKVRLLDGSGHPGAIAAAAMIRDAVANNEPINMQYSIEGSTIEKKGQRLARSIARRVAATIKPCNKSCSSGLLSDPHAPDAVEESSTVEKREVHPAFAPLGGAREYEGNPIVKDDGDDQFEDLDKADYGAAPGTLTGLSALSTEDIQKRRKLVRFWKNNALAALRDWKGEGTFRDFLKNRLPEADPVFIDRFADLVDEYKVRKSAPDLPDFAMLELRKFEALTVELRHTLSELRKSEENASAIHFAGRTIIPGRAQGLQPKNAGQFHVLHEDKDHYFVAPAYRQFSAADIRKWPKAKEGTHFQIKSLPQAKEFMGYVDSARHAVPGLTRTQEQRDLMHGLDMLEPTYEPDPAHHKPGINEITFNRGGTGWRKAPNGQLAYVKRDDKTQSFSSPRREALYHNLAHDFFQLGHYVPLTAVFRDPHDGSDHSMSAAIPNAEHTHYVHGDIGNEMHLVPHQLNAIRELGDRGELDKLFLMNAIQGNRDRHASNYMFTDRAPFVQLIDHGYSHADSPDTPEELAGALYHEPHYQKAYARDLADRGLADDPDWRNHPLHEDAKNWLLGLDPRQLTYWMKANGAPDHLTRRALHRLLLTQGMAKMPAGSAPMKGEIHDAAWSPE